MQALHVTENFKNVWPSDDFFIVLNHFVKLHYTYQIKDNTYVLYKLEEGQGCLL